MRAGIPRSPTRWSAPRSASSWHSNATIPLPLRELFFTEDGPIDDLELIVTLGRLSAYLAAKLGAQEDPPADAGTVLARLALEWGGPAS